MQSSKILPLLVPMVLAAFSATARADDTHFDRWPPPPPPPRSALVQCIARNLRGQDFVAIGRNVALAETRALDKCDRVSVSCRIVDCRRL